jgi:hypothetical protein
MAEKVEIDSTGKDLAIPKRWRAVTQIQELGCVYFTSVAFTGDWGKRVRTLPVESRIL